MILQELQNNGQLNKRKRIREGKNPTADAAVKTFINQARQQNIPVNGLLIKGKAKHFSEMLNIPNFKASSGWLTCFSKRTGLKWRCLTGDAAAANVGEAAEWVDKILKPLINRFDENDIFNGDEAGLFYRCLPGKSMVFKGDDCKIGKYGKERVTLMLCSNMTGTEKLKPLLIGKSKKPRCFKNIKTLPVDYYFNRKSWMNSFIFET